MKKAGEKRRCFGKLDKINKRELSQVARAV